LIADQIPDVSRKAARKQASATLATMIGALVLSRVAGNGEFSEDILAAGREAALSGSGAKKTAAKKPSRAASARH
jgi:TetR/AcrR family transcriptional repressor of nem operon